MSQRIRDTLVLWTELSTWTRHRLQSQFQVHPWGICENLQWMQLYNSHLMMQMYLYRPVKAGTVIWCGTPYGETLAKSRPGSTHARPSVLTLRKETAALASAIHTKQNRLNPQIAWRLFSAIGTWLLAHLREPRHRSWPCEKSKDEAIHSHARARTLSEESSRLPFNKAAWHVLDVFYHRITWWLFSAIGIITRRSKTYRQPACPLNT